MENMSKCELKIMEEALRLYSERLNDRACHYTAWGWADELLVCMRERRDVHEMLAKVIEALEEVS